MAMTRHPSLAVHPGHGPKSEIVENHSVKADTLQRSTKRAPRT